jgi:actin-related protein 10
LNPREKPQDKSVERSVVIIENLMTPRPLINALAHVLLKSYGVRSVYFFLGNSLPLYVTGMDTGLLVDCGFQQTQILPIVRSRLCVEGFEVCYAGCGVNIEKELNYNIVYDNKESFKANSTTFNETGDVQYSFPKDVLEDIKVRALQVMHREQRDEYLSSPENIEKMKKKKQSLGK